MPKERLKVYNTYTPLAKTIKRGKGITKQKGLKQPQQEPNQSTKLRLEDNYL